MTGERARPALYLALGAVLLAAGAALWLPRWWENREYRRMEAVAGVGAPILPGALTEARKLIDPGLTAEKVTETLGKASFAARTEGAVTHEIRTYYYADGTLTVNLTDGVVSRVSTEYGPPKIRKSKRP